MQEWDRLTALLHHIGDVRVAIRTLHTLRQWGKEDPERLRKDLLRLLALPHWWNVLPSSPWRDVAHLFTLTLAEHLHADLKPALVPLLQSRDPLVRERAARMLKTLGYGPGHRIDVARYVVAKRNLRAVGHLANKIPRALREAMPSERFLEWSKGKWMFLPADDTLSDLVFAVEALERIPVKSINSVPAVELLLDFCGSSRASRERALALLQQVPEDSSVWKHVHVQRRLQALRNLSVVFQTAEVKALQHFEQHKGSS
ncbi:hypothetical protein [Deinococcus cellulosilyticus]|uniref:Uncharacterized protein n=1 Tax=Deinococcus cellulosilyticus (strain DSM 18568 / NBRC 106333 / KACC 11606 / 5516J-15) TaxID=1223518 RepID=A0A511N1Y7_DEIC1|nr:hypothetical protein [Deinococcus cellulosilyticus]GEM46864.1 hypothetical protein DC3_24990 [Deinococcus cellulosilyticus NBRC 106333 = KACC 11606]